MNRVDGTTRAGVLIILVLSLAAVLQGCSLERPRVASQLSGGNSKAGFDHTGVTAACASCHAQILPVSHVAINGADCGTCHKTSSWTITGSNAHVPPPTSCNSCHGPGTAFNRLKPNHRPIDGKDCVGCHSVSTWKVSATTAHQPVPKTCVACHGPGGAYDRFKPTHKPINGRDCASCHSVSTWKVSAATAHQPPPTSCNSCHATGAVFDRFKPTHKPIGTRDCIACHVTADWKKVAVAHTPMPSACSTCHEPDRPRIARLPRGGTLTNHYGQKDCFACHETGSYRFAHQTASRSNVGFCLPCHDSEGRRKHGRKHPDYFNGDGTCARCHSYRGGWD